MIFLISEMTSSIVCWKFVAPLNLIHVLRTADAVEAEVLLICSLSAFAVSIVSNAHAVTNDWFDAGINAYDSWPSDGSNTNIVGQGTWSGTANATLDTESPTKALVVNAAGDSKLTFEVDTKVNAETTNATYNATMTFPNVSTAVSELSDPGAGVKAGLAVAKSGV